MDILGELGRALVATVRLLAGVETHVGLQVRGGAESLAAIHTSVRFLTCK
jgi:hypothetical protein